MEKMKLMMLAMLVALMGGALASCGDDKSDNGDNGGGGGNSYGTYTLHVDLIDQGTLPDYAFVVLVNSMANYGGTLPNVTLETAKAALDEAFDSFKNPMAAYSFTLEFYITNASNNKVYSRTLQVKATEDENGEENGEDNKEANYESPSASTYYVLRCTISDIGTLPPTYAAILKQGLEESVKERISGVSLEDAKKMVDKAVTDAVANGDYNGEEYNYTIEFYITDSEGNKLYSRYIVVKDGSATVR